MYPTVTCCLNRSPERPSRSAINRVLQYCYAYDPEGQSYVLNITKVSATLIMFLAVVLLAVLFLFKKRKTT